MTIQQMLLGTGGFAVDSAKFDGATYIARGAGLTGAADGTSGIISAWMRFDAAAQATNFREIFDSTTGGATDRFRIQTPASNVLEVIGLQTTGVAAVQLSTTTTFPGSDTTWYHFLASWDVTTAGARNLYLNDSLNMTVVAFVNATIDYTYADWTFGATSGGGTADFFNGCLAEFYFAPNQYLDLSVTANRRKFISGDLKPVSLGADGASPTGTAPLIYLHLDKGQAASNFVTNRGTGGNFSVSAGSLTTGSSSPSG